MRSAVLLLHVAIVGLVGGDSAIPHYTVNLNLPPEARWRHVINAHRQEVLGTMGWWDNELKRADPKGLQEWLRVQDLSEEHLSELRGIIAAAGAPPANLYGLILLQFLYELNYPTYCTGIVAAMPNGTVVHGRNMDQLGNSHIIEVTFEKDGQALYSIITKPAFTGVHTGVRLGGWSVALNRREPGPGGFGENLAAARRASRSTGHLLRRVLEEVPDYAAALDRLSNSKYMAPTYLTLAGTAPYEGAVITANRFAVGGLASTVRRLDASGGWSLVQTNEDFSTGHHTPRYRRALGLVARRGQKRMAPDALQDILRTPPYVLNYMTQFTWVVVPATGAVSVVKATKEYFVKHFEESALATASAAPAGAGAGQEQQRGRKTPSLRGEALELDPPAADPMETYWLAVLGEDPLAVSNPSPGWRSPDA